MAPVRRAAESLAAELGLDEQLEARRRSSRPRWPTNLVRHAGGGEVVLRPSAIFTDVLDVITWDRGPGWPTCPARCRDGVSTVGGAGNGLGAMGRLSATFDLQSTPGRGTVGSSRGSAPRRRRRIDGLALAMAGEEASGDAWRPGPRRRQVPRSSSPTGSATASRRPRAAAAAVRELRAGVDARGAARADARRAARRRAGAAAADRPARPGDGGAPVRRDRQHRREDRRRRARRGRCVSMNGTLGHSVRRDPGLRPRARARRAARDALRRRDAAAGTCARTPGSSRRDPLVIASVLVRDFERGRDDVSVVVARGHGGAGVSAGALRARRTAPRRGRRRRAPARPRRRRDPRLRPPGPDADRDGHVGARAQRLPLRPAAAGCCSPARRGAARSRSSDDGPGIPHLDDVLSGAYRSATGMGQGLRRRAAADGRRSRSRARPRRGTRVVVSKRDPARRARARRARRRATSSRGARAGEPVRRGHAPERGAAAGARRGPRATGGAAPPQPRAREHQPRRRRPLRRARRPRRAAARRRRAQVALPGRHEPRAAHAAELDRRPDRAAPRRRAAARGRAGEAGRLHPADGRRSAPARLRPARHRQDRGRAGRRRTSATSRSPSCSRSCARSCGRWSATRPVALRFVAAPDLPPLHTDEAKLVQVLRNLVSNAIKFTPAGEIVVGPSTTARPCGSPSATPGSGSRRTTSPGCSTSSSRSPARCSATAGARGWASRWCKRLVGLLGGPDRP